MPLDNGTNIGDMNSAIPDGTESRRQIDELDRDIKRMVKASFPGFTDAATGVVATKTGPQIEDGAEKSADETITGNWDFTGTTVTLVNPIDEISTDGTLADNSDTAVPTEKAVKTYVDSNKLSLLGTINTPSGSSAELTGIPAGTNEIVCLFQGVEISGDLYHLINLGDAVDYANSSEGAVGYNTIYQDWVDNVGAHVRSGAANKPCDARVSMLREDGTNRWNVTVSGGSGGAGANAAHSGGGYIDNGGVEVDRINVSVSGAGSLAGGSIQVFTRV